jgi:cell division control protein 6
MTIPEESKVFKDEEVLSAEYLPDLLSHRENQIKQLADNLSPAARGKRPQNTFLFGVPGIGKTHVAKFVFREFEEFSERVKTIYINCWDYNTAISILSKIVIDLGVPIQRRGWAKDEILNKLTETLKKINKSLVVCLDEIDQLKEEGVLYDLLRINQYVKNPVGLIFISNDPWIFAEMEPRIKSSLAVEEIEFKPYTIQEMKDILQERIKHALHAGVENAALLLMANHGVKKGGDVRIGLECLLKAGRQAEKENSTRIKVEHVRKILPNEKAKPRILKERISDVEKTILKILEKVEKLQSGKLYEKYCKKVDRPLTQRMFRNYINHLAKIGLIKIKKIKSRGNVRIISKT